VVVELSDHGLETYRKAVGVQGEEEALMAAALHRAKPTRQSVL
jgi:hypothetical protein